MSGNTQETREYRIRAFFDNAAIKNNLLQDEPESMETLKDHIDILCDKLNSKIKAHQPSDTPRLTLETKSFKNRMLPLTEITVQTKMEGTTEQFTITNTGGGKFHLDSTKNEKGQHSVALPYDKVIDIFWDMVNKRMPAELITAITEEKQELAADNERSPK